MECLASIHFDNNVWIVIDQNMPHESSKSVALDCMQMLSNLPLERRQEVDDPLIARHPNDLLLRSHLASVLQEIAEIRNSIKSISPFLRNSQQVAQNKVFAYARNHTSYSRRVRLLRSGKASMKKENGTDDTGVKSVFNRLWYRVLSVISPVLANRDQEVTAKREVKEAFENFYMDNGISFRTLMARTLIQCKRLEIMLSNIKRKIKEFDSRESAHNDAAEGIAFQLRVHRGHLSLWRRDFDYVWKQVRNVRRLFGLVPVHNCWEAIFNIMTSQGQLNHYI